MKAMQLIMLSLASTALTACIYEDYDPLRCAPVVARLTASYDREWEYPYSADGRQATDWQTIWPSLGFSKTYDQLRPGRPDGLRTMLYQDDEEELADVRNLSSWGGYIYITGEDPSLLVYNNDTEYDLVDDSEDASTAYVTTRMMQRESFAGSPYAKDVTALASPPDMLYHCYIPEIEWADRADTLLLHADMAPLVFTYAIRYGFSHGLEYVALARGVLSGMARGVRLAEGQPLNARVGVGFDADKGSDCVEAYVRTFGHFPGNTGVSYGLNLEMRLTNGRYVTYDYDITDQMRYQPRGGVILISGIEIPDSIGRQPSGGGFDVTVDGWGAFVDIPVEL